jgi:hypothetical protein
MSCLPLEPQAPVRGGVDTSPAPLPQYAHFSIPRRSLPSSINPSKTRCSYSFAEKLFDPFWLYWLENPVQLRHLIPVGLILSLAWSNAAWASDAGTTSADYLKLGVGPRAISMGDAQVGLADDVYATHYNPAGLATLKTQEAAFTHTDYLQGISEQYLAYAYPHPKWGALGVSFTYLGYGTFQGYDASGQPTGSVGANDMDLGLSYSRYLYHDERYGTELAAGVTGKWIQERLDTVKATTFAGDLGLLFAPGIKWGELLNGWKAGVALRNVGQPMTFDQESFALPRVLTAGLSYTGNWRDESITLAVDGRQPNDGPRNLGVGLEIWTLQFFVLRGGYTTEGDLGNGLSLGAGVRFRTIQVDYAFASEGPLGNTQRFGLTLRFAAPKPNLVLLAQHSFETGMREFKQGRYNESMADFTKTMELDPKHPEAVEMMKRTYEKLRETTQE